MGNPRDSRRASGAHHGKGLLNILNDNVASHGRKALVVVLWGVSRAQGLQKGDQVASSGGQTEVADLEVFASKVPEDLRVIGLEYSGAATGACPAGWHRDWPG